MAVAIVRPSLSDVALTSRMGRWASEAVCSCWRLQRQRCDRLSVVNRLRMLGAKRSGFEPAIQPRFRKWQGPATCDQAYNWRAFYDKNISGPSIPPFLRPKIFAFCHISSAALCFLLTTPWLSYHASLPCHWQWPSFGNSKFARASARRCMVWRREYHTADRQCFVQSVQRSSSFPFTRLQRYVGVSSPSRGKPCTG